MYRLILFIFLNLTAVLAALPPALAEKRVALVIGNSAYDSAGVLPNPVRDAKGVAGALREAGFEVTEGANFTKAQFDVALKRFGDAVDGADWAVVYYAGHGIGIGGESYLLPTDVILARPEHVAFEAVGLSHVRAVMDGAKTLRLIVLDSCRNNPFVARMAAVGGKRAVSRGLPRPTEVEGGELVAYATKENDVADDGEGEHSPFTAAFLQNLPEPGLEVSFFFRRVRSSVLKATRNTQDPAIYASLGDTPLYFVPPKAQAPQPQPTATLDEVTKLREQVARLEEALKAKTTNEGEKALRERLADLEDKLKEEGPKPGPLITSVDNASASSVSGTKSSAVVQDSGSQAAQGVSQIANAAPPPDSIVAPSNTACDGLLVSVATGMKPCIKPGSGQAFRDCPECPEMTLLPAGSFLMGSPTSEEGRFDTEGPQRKVTIPQPFAVGRAHVTRGQFAAFVKASGHKTESGCYAWSGGEWKEDLNASWRRPGFEQTDSHPVVCVNWDDAKAYVTWLSDRVGKRYRLLSEAETEYAARGVTVASQQPRYFFGNEVTELCSYGNGADQTAKEKFKDWVVAPCKDGFTYTAPVMSFKANAFGLYDVYGNAWSWTDDCWNNSYNGAPTDGSARASVDCSRRVLRGGSWLDIARDLRSAYRLRSGAQYRNGNMGFRVARNLTP